MAKSLHNLLRKVYTRHRMLLLDLMLLNLCLALSYFLRFEGAWLDNVRPHYFPILTVLGLFVFYFSSLYNRLWRYASIGELLAIIKNSAAINFLFLGYIFFFQQDLPRSIPLLNGILMVFTLGGVRFSFRLLSNYLEKLGHRHPDTDVLIIGAGDAGEMIVRELQRHPELGKHVAGLIDDDQDKQNLHLHGVEVLGTRRDIPAVIQEKNIDEVIIAIPSAPGNEIKEIYNMVQKQDVQVKTVPGMYEILNDDISISQLREVQVEDLLRRDPVDLDIDGICSYLAGRTVMVTGGGGSIGSELCRQIADYEPDNLIILDIYENSTYMLQRELQDEHPDLEIIPVIASVRDRECMKQTFSYFQPDVVFHAAAHKHVPLMEANPGEAVKNNIMGTEVTARLADEFGAERFVLISTDKAVNPTNVMGATKRASEMVVQWLDERSRTDFMAVRFGNVLGSCGSVVPIFKKQIAQGGPVTVTHREVRRYFMTIPEAVQLVIQAGAQGEGGELFVLDMGEPVKIIDLARDLISLSGYRPNEDIDIEITGLRPGEKLYEELLTEHEDSEATEHERIYISNIENNLPKDLPLKLKTLEEVANNGENQRSLIAELKDLVKTFEPRWEKEDLQPAFEKRQASLGNEAAGAYIAPADAADTAKAKKSLEKAEAAGEMVFDNE